MTILNFLSKKVLSVDLGSENLKVVEGFYRKNKLTVYEKLEIPREKLDNRNYLIGIVLRNSYRFKKTNIALNPKKFIYEYLKLPDLKDNDFKKIFYNKYNNKYYKDYLIQYIYFKSEELKYNTGVAILIKETYVEWLKEGLQIIKLRQNILGNNSYNIVKLLNLGKTINNNYSVENKLIMNVDLGSSYIDITFFENYNLKYIKSFENGFNSILEELNKEEDKKLLFEDYVKKLGNVFKLNRENPLERKVLNYMENILRLINLTRDFYLREYLKDISYIVLTGGGSNIQGIDNFLSNLIDRQVIVLRSLENLDLKTKLPLNIYGNAIGGLISGDEVLYV